MDTSLPAPPRRWPAALVWFAGWAAMTALDGRLDLANLAMLLVLSAAIAALWLPALASVAAGTLAVVVFNWQFVPPRHTFSVDLHQHALLLLAMLVVNVIVATLMAGQRRAAAAARRHAERAEQQRAWGDTLRDADEPLLQAGALQAALARTADAPAALLLQRETLPERDDDTAMLVLGEPDGEQRAGLWHCLRHGQAMGPGTGRHAELPDLYLPLRGRGGVFGAALLRGRWRDGDDDRRDHAQALCDAMGAALQRARIARDAAAARQAAETQGVRNALLAAISHDHRTPLATILSAATSLDEQAERLDPAQRRRLARSIADEATRLARLTDNTLQLARLDAPGVQLRCDWESAEEVVGAVLRRARARDPGRRLRARLEPELPLLWCDALLIAQLLDNLVDNALKYSPEDAPVELLVRRQGEQVVLAVRDRGPGIAPAWRERVFEVFHRGAEAMAGTAEQRARPGAGVGLAVCRAIARAHGGELRLRPRAHGGCSFECLLPVRSAPPGPRDEP